MQRNARQTDWVLNRFMWHLLQAYHLTYMYAHIYIYVFNFLPLSLSICIYVYIYIYVYISYTIFLRGLLESHRDSKLTGTRKSATVAEPRKNSLPVASGALKVSPRRPLSVQGGSQALLERPKLLPGSPGAFKLAPMRFERKSCGDLTKFMKTLLNPRSVEKTREVPRELENI